ncbi:hypothetical protein LCGC14_1326190 [marine sediment metagenome]|uniref:Uncharacterized protein n=1 Tax=marine sediment metagenome TaxID=412755 RepID=A0A0F9KIN5_9ZZZZ
MQLRGEVVTDILYSDLNTCLRDVSEACGFSDSALYVQAQRTIEGGENTRKAMEEYSMGSWEV